VNAIAKIRASALKAMQELHTASFDPSAHGSIDRVTVDVTDHQQREVVTVRLRENALTWSCTCGRRPCEHVQLALSWISGDANGQVHKGKESEIGPTTSAWSHLSWPPDLRTIEDFDQAVRADIPALAASLEELITVTVAAGISAGLTSPVATAIDRLIAISPKPLPLGISRWVGRFRVSLTDRSVDGAARLLDGASKLVDDLRSGSRDMPALERVVSWLGAYSADKRTIERVSDRSLLEIAREWMDGTDRCTIEKRARDLSAASLGPCPRLITVGLAVAEQGAHPRRIRLLQYSTAVAIPAQAWEQLASWASRAFSPLREVYQHAIVNYPGLCEPFVIIAPARLVRDPLPIPIDESGHPLPLAAARDLYAVKVIDAMTAQQRPDWIAGRLVDAQGTLMIRPLSFGITLAGRFHHVRI
jgi:hypothetical protein